MAKQKKRTHLKLIKAFDREGQHEQNVAREKEESGANVTVIDFSSNYAAVQTCLSVIENLKRFIPQIEADTSIPVEARTEKLAFVLEQIEKFERIAVAHAEAYEDELKRAA